MNHLLGLQNTLSTLEEFSRVFLPDRLLLCCSVLQSCAPGIKAYYPQAARRSRLHWIGSLSLDSISMRIYLIITESALLTQLNRTKKYPRHSPQGVLLLAPAAVSLAKPSNKIMLSHAKQNKAK